MSFRYLSAEWLAEGRRRAERSQDFLAAAKGVTVTILNVVQGAPGGRTLYLRYGFKDGKVSDLVLGEDPKIAEMPTELRATGSYETFTLINQGILGVGAAVLQRKIKIQGNMAHAVKLVKPLDALNRALRQIPTVY